MAVSLAWGPVVGPLFGVAEEEGAEVAHGVGAAFLPTHAGAFESLGDEALAAGLNGARADLPAVRVVTRIVHAMLMVAEVLSLFAIDLAPPAAPVVGIELFPLRQEGRAPCVLQMMTPLLGERCGGRGVVGMTSSGERGNVLTRVKEVEHRCRRRKGLALTIFQAAARIADRELLLGRIPTDLSCLSPQSQAERIEVV